MKPLILSLLLAGSLTALNAHADGRNFERTPGARLASQSQHIDRAGRADLRRDINNPGRHIYNERHDGDRRWQQANDNGRHQGWTQGRNNGWSDGRGESRFDGRHDNRGGAWIDREQRQQREMLERGVRSGRITPAEFRRLSAQQHTIRAEERSYRSDGQLSGAERADLRQDLALAWRNIRNEISDGERRYR